MNTHRRLFKSDDPVFAGVCGGVAEYFELDPTLIRILAVIVVLAGVGLPIIAYIIAMIIMPKRSGDYPDYIEVQPAAAQAAGASASAAGATGATGAASATGWTGAATAQEAPPVGCAYTTCNPKAYDAADPAEQVPDHHQRHTRLRNGVMVGVVLVAIGLLALLATFFDLSVWRFWPVIVIVLGFMMLCTPSRNGWRLERAGHAISCITVGLTLQLWTLGLISGNAFFHTFVHLWPILLVILGLSVIGSATEQSVFKLFGSLLFSATLLFGVWSFGQLGGPIRIDLPGDRAIEFVIPSPQFLIPDSALTSLDGTTGATGGVTGSTALTPRR
jgi:phage shock protein C